MNVKDMKDKNRMGLKGEDNEMPPMTLGWLKHPFNFFLFSYKGHYWVKAESDLEGTGWNQG